MLRDSLQIRWQAGLRGAAADTLEALAEAAWRLDEGDAAATLLETANRLREETGFVRQPVYEERYQRVLAGVSGHRPAAPPDIEQTVAAAIHDDLAKVASLA